MRAAGSPGLIALGQRLFAPVDIAALVYFRVAFSGVMLWEIWRYWSRDRIGRYWVQPDFHFSYYGFHWVQPWPGDGMYYHFALMGVCALFMLLGLWYRLSAILFFLGFTYIFLLDQARYLNHFYLIVLLSFLMIWVPAHRWLSLDVLRHPEQLSQTAPAWNFGLLRFQIAIPYVYGGIAKLNGDWLRGEPMGMWLAARTDFPLIGQWFTESWMVYGLSYGGLLLDLLVVPGLLWRRTRWLAFTLALVFHLMNAELFIIGIFPWFMMAATALFFEPDWPRRWLPGGQGWSRHPHRSKHPQGGNQEGSFSSPALTGRQWAIALGLALYSLIQLIVPFRHWTYPGDVAWTEEGHRFSWRMKLRSNRGRAEFFVRDPLTDTVQRVHPEDYLAPYQVRKLPGRPEMVLQFSHYLARRFTAPDAPVPVEVRAYVLVSLNGREPQLLIDPTVDLAQVPLRPPPADWILPLTVASEAPRSP